MFRRTLLKLAAASGAALTIATHSERERTIMASQTTESTPVSTGYAPVNGLEMYYELHGEGGVPLVVLHGGLFNIDLQYAHLLPAFSANRQVIACDFQAHGRTNDIDRPFSAAAFASDVAGLLDHLGVTQADVLGYSIGAAVATELAVSNPQVVRKLVASSVSFSPDGVRPENAAAMGGMTVDMIAGTPMEQDYLAKSPNPEKLQDLLDKLGSSGEGFSGWSDEQIQGIAAPTLITVGDCDMVQLEHAIHMLRLRGGDVNGDFVGVPASQLAIIPGATHFSGYARADLIPVIVLPFLDAPMPEDVPATPLVG